MFTLSTTLVEKALPKQSLTLRFIFNQNIENSLCDIGTKRKNYVW